MAGGANTVICARGKSVTRFDMRKDKPDPATLLKGMLGPTGNLRAPAVRVGRTVIVGFSDEVYSEVIAK